MLAPKSLFDDYAFISLGANLNSSIGSPADSIHYAIDFLADFSESPLLISSLLETAPVDCPPNSPMYTNGVVGLLPKINETPLSLLRRLQAIEAAAGRVRTGLRNEARVLDLDLLTFRDEIESNDTLILPHPRACIRGFVLLPLRELVGNAVFPGQNLLIDELISRL